MKIIKSLFKIFFCMKCTSDCITNPNEEEIEKIKKKKQEKKEMKEYLKNY